MSESYLWIVGMRNMANHLEWEFVGVYDCKDKAFAVCKDARFFVGRTTLNETVPEETTPWPEHYQPSMEEPAK